MGLGGISPWSLVIILVIVLLLFGTKKLRGLGGDLGGALKGFKKAMADDNDEKDVKDVKDVKKVESEETAPEQDVAKESKDSVETK